MQIFLCFTLKKYVVHTGDFLIVFSSMKDMNTCNISITVFCGRAYNITIAQINYLGVYALM